ncbi:hypothetical protein INT45_005374 [Circinella minor]|uniref:Protection of telomeres protein 1 n=1 Tax=Circinella minor TaxID=1195481 RepID=A0A8H7S2B7_9FUNG|nr:hypothetical protein INT45_005374 [Circinella minor]
MTDIIEQLKNLGVKPLNEFQHGTKEKLYGVIQLAKPHYKSRGPDYIKVMNITDPSLGWENPRFSINMFYPEPEAFPFSAAEGDIVIFTDMRVTLYQGTKKQMLLDKSVSRWAIMDRVTSNIRPTGHKQTQYTLTDNDVEIVNLLKNWYRETTGSADDQMDVDLPGNQVRAVEDNSVDIMNHPTMYATGGNRPILPTNKILGHSRFLDYIGMVVASHKYERVNDCHVLLLTDYTENPKPMSGYEASETIDPKYLIQGTLWDEHARGCPELKFGDIVYLKNLQSKISQFGVMEVVLRGEKNPQTGYGKCKIQKFDHPDHIYVQALKLRQERYEKKFKRSTSEKIQEVTPAKVITGLFHDSPFTTIYKNENVIYN